MSASPDMLAQTRNTIAGLRGKIDEQQQLLANASYKIRETRQHLEAKHRSVVELTHKQASIETSERAAKERVRSLEDKLRVTSEQRNQYESHIEKLESQLVNWRKEHEEIKLSAGQKDTQFQILQCNHHKLQYALEAKENLLAETQLALRKADTKCGSLEQTNNILQSENTTAMKSLKEELNEVLEAKKAADERGKNLSVESIEYQAQIKILQVSNDRLVEQMSNSTQQLSAEWATSQIRFKDSVDTKIKDVEWRLEQALHRQKHLAKLLSQSAEHTRNLNERILRKKRIVQDIKLLLSREHSERCKLEKNAHEASLSLDRVKREHCTVCERLGQCTKRLASSTADAAVITEERNALAATAKAHEQLIDRLTHDCELHKNMSVELRAELSAMRASIEQRQHDRDRELNRISLQEKATRESLLEENVRIRRRNRTLLQELDSEKSKSRLYSSSHSDSKVNTDKHSVDLIDMIKHSYDKQTADSQSVSGWHHELLDKVENLIHRVENKVVNASQRAKNGSYT